MLAHIKQRQRRNITNNNNNNNNNTIIIMVMGKVKTPLQFLQYNVKVYVDHIGSRCPTSTRTIITS
jgi:hypothetical protein